MAGQTQQQTVKDTDWYLIEVDAMGPFPTVRVVSRWHYAWVLAPGAKPWAVGEKDFYHQLINLLLRRAFENVRIQMTARAISFATTLRVEFMVGNALEKYKHWQVFFSKMPPGSTPLTLLSGVDPSTRTIRIDTADVYDYTACNAFGQCGTVNAIPHEFLHATGYHHDEYNPASPHFGDSRSIMNVGRQVRERHLTMILADLEDLVPDATFSLVKQ